MFDKIYSYGYVILKTLLKRGKCSCDKHMDKNKTEKQL